MSDVKRKNGYISTNPGRKLVAVSKGAPTHTSVVYHDESECERTKNSDIVWDVSVTPEAPQGRCGCKGGEPIPRFLRPSFPEHKLGREQLGEVHGVILMRKRN